MVLVAVRQGGWTAWAVGKDTQWNPMLKGDYEVRVHLDKMVLVVVRRLDHISGGPYAQGKVGKRLLAAKGPTKQTKWQPKVRETITLFLVDDEEVRLLLMTMNRWEQQWSHRSMQQQVGAEGLSVCTQILQSDLIIKTLLTEQWKERGGVSPHICQVKRLGGGRK